MGVKKEDMENESNDSMPTTLSVRVTQSSLIELGDQRNILKRFIKTQLVNGIDYGIIPGTPKASLYKPGAEKIANIFQLGSRIVDRDKTIDIKNNFAMFQMTVEVFHLPSGKAIAQCEGVANSQEVKYKERSKYEKNERGQKERVGKEETPVADVLNTLTKMAQKRAYVGAVIIATGASDFFTQDLDERDTVENGKPGITPKPAPAAPKVGDPGDYVVTFGKKYKGQTLNQMGREDVVSFRGYLLDSAAADGKPLGGAVKEFVDMANAFLAPAPDSGKFQSGLGT